MYVHLHVHSLLYTSSYSEIWNRAINCVNSCCWPAPSATHVFGAVSRATRCPRCRRSGAHPTRASVHTWRSCSLASSCSTPRLRRLPMPRCRLRPASSPRNPRRVLPPPHQQPRLRPPLRTSRTWTQRSQRSAPTPDRWSPRASPIFSPIALRCCAQQCH